MSQQNNGRRPPATIGLLPGQVRYRQHPRWSALTALGFWPGRGRRRCRGRRAYGGGRRCDRRGRCPVAMRGGVSLRPVPELLGVTPASGRPFPPGPDQHDPAETGSRAASRRSGHGKMKSQFSGMVAGTPAPPMEAAVIGSMDASGQWQIGSLFACCMPHNGGHERSIRCTLQRARRDTAR
jgi:hypothetical protein